MAKYTTGFWVERTPEAGETVRFELDGEARVGVYMMRGAGSAQTFWVVDIGNRRIWAWELTTFFVWDNNIRKCPHCTPDED